MENKQLQYTYCSISQEMKQSNNEIWSFNIIWETFSLKSHTKCGGETIPRHFPKFSCFCCIPCWGLLNIFKISCRPFAFTSFKVFFPASFSAWFLKKYFLVIVCQLTKFHCLVAFTSWDIGQYVYCTSLLTRLPCHKFWN